MADYSSLDSWKLRMQESDRIFYGKINEIRAHMGMALVQIPCYDNKKQELPEVSRRSQPNSDSNAIPRNAVPAIVVPGASLTEGSRDLSGRSSQSDGEVLSLSEVPGTLLNWRADSVRQGRHEVGSKEASTLGSGISFADGFQKVQASAKQLLQALRQTRCDLQEWREEIAGSTQEIDSSKVTQMGGGHTQDSTPEIVGLVEDSTPEAVTSKIEPVQNESFLDEYNLLDEMSMEDESAKLQEMGDFESLKVTSLLLLEEIDGASSKVVSASLTEFVVEPHFVLLNDDGLPIIENINAHKVFVEKSRPSVHQLEPSEINLHEESQSVIDMVVDKHRLWNGNLIFDPGIAYLSSAIRSLSFIVLGSIREETSIDVLLSKDRRNWVFDPGGSWLLLSK